MTRRLGWAIALVAGLLVLAELLVRVPPIAATLDHTYPSSTPTEREIKRQATASDAALVTDVELGNRGAPRRRDTVRTPDFTYLLETDSAGFPNREPWPARPDVVLLGNSLITGPGVGIDGQFSTRLGQKLGGVTVLNLGIGGVSPALQYRIYRRYAAGLRAPVVLGSLWVASDVDNAVHFDRWLAEEQGRGRDFYQFRTGYGTSHASTQARARTYLKRQSRLVGTLGVVTNTLERRGKYTEQVEFPSGEVIFLSGRAQERLAAGVARRELPNLREVFFDPLLRLRDTVEAHGGRFAVVLIPSKEELYGAKRFPAVLRTIGEVRARLDSAGVRTVDLYAPIRARAGEASPFFRRDIHLNLLGNELAATAIAEWLRAEDLSDTPRAGT